MGMGYEFMLLADPGPSRETVLQAIQDWGDARPDPQHEHRFWVSAGAGEYQVNIGTKDPIESIQVECPGEDLTLREHAARRSLALADRLEMRIEDCIWGDEVSTSNLDQLIRSWTKPAVSIAASSPVSGAKRPWWRIF